MPEPRPTLLIVDDEAKNLYALRHLLRDLDIDVVEASSGQDALREALNHEFFLVLMDAKMPDMSGFETAKLMSGMEGTDHIPIIFVTAHRNEDIHVLEGYESGAVDYIQKPIDPPVLLSKVNVFKKLWEQQVALKQFNQKLQDFTRVVSHDLKQPLNTVIGFTRRLLKVKSQQLDAETVEMLERVMHSGKRMSLMINGLLDYSQTEHHELVLKKVDLNLTAANVRDDLASTIEERAATIILKPLPVVLADEQQMYQVFLNIVANALKFQRPGVNPVIIIDGLSVADPLSPSLVEQKVRIGDNGIGFDMAEVDKIFTPFQRLATESEFEGSGIGMGTVKKIMDRHGGKISAQSTVGEGSTFTLIFSDNVAEI